MGIAGQHWEGAWVAPLTGDAEWHVRTAEWTNAPDFHLLVSLPLQDVPALPAR